MLPLPQCVFSQANIQKNGSPEDWRYREAATFAFGSILEGPTVETLAQLARSGLGFLLTALKDSNPSVKNTTAWTIGEPPGASWLLGMGWAWAGAALGTCTAVQGSCRSAASCGAAKQLARGHGIARPQGRVGAEC